MENDILGDALFLSDVLDDDAIMISDSFVGMCEYSCFIEVAFEDIIL